MNEEIERTARDVLAGEQFGVLAVAAAERIHTATILFAESPDWELVHAIRPPTLKARLSSLAPRVAFQVDNRAVTATDRTHFVRIGLEGALRHVGRDDPGWQRYHDIYAAKFPFGDALLQEPEVELYVLTPAVMRVAVGAQPAVDIALSSPYEGEMPASLRPAGPFPPSPSPDIGGGGGERREPGAGAG
jgi:hypothetical protein